MKCPKCGRDGIIALACEPNGLSVYCNLCGAETVLPFWRVVEDVQQGGTIKRKGISAKVNILGTEYSIVECKPEADTRLDGGDGCCDDSVKEIVLTKHEPEPGYKHDLEAVRRKILRHEIVHAFLCESGLAENSDWAQNEELVDWIAIQGPKLWEAWKEAGAVE